MLHETGANDMDVNVPWDSFSVAALGWISVAAFVTAILRGKLVPRASLDDAIHDRDEWRAESRIKDQQIATKDEQLSHLSEVGETQKAVLNALGKLGQGTTL